MGKLLAVNPTRMELNNLKRRLVTARRGHKLLKDKRDELMRRFLIIVRENNKLRTDLEAKIGAAHTSFMLARAGMSESAVDTALISARERLSVSVKTNNVMSVIVPNFTVKQSNKNHSSDIISYSFGSTTASLDSALIGFDELLPEMLRLAECEKTAQLLAAEIERTRRRVNALEHIMMPQLSDTIRSITMKLEENDRASRTRLMKVKDMMIKDLYK